MHIHEQSDYMCTYIYGDMHIHTHTRTHRGMHTCIHKCASVHTHIHTHTHTHTHSHTCTYIMCIHACAWVLVRARVHTCTRTHTHTEGYMPQNFCRHVCFAWIHSSSIWVSVCRSDFKCAYIRLISFCNCMHMWIYYCFCHIYMSQTQLQCVTFSGCTYAGADKCACSCVFTCTQVLSCMYSCTLLNTNYHMHSVFMQIGLP